MDLAPNAGDDKPFTLADSVRAGRYRFSAASGEAFLNERPVHLTARELDLALFFFKRVGQRLARADISRQVWGHGPAIVSRTLDAHVSNLRRKLALGTANGFRLSGLYGFGYRLEPASEVRSSP